MLNLKSSLCLLLSISSFGVCHKLPSSDEDSIRNNKTGNVDNVIRSFWDGVLGEEHIIKLSSENFERFTGENKESFIFFYTNWCKSSQQVREEFAKVAMEMAYTEGFTPRYLKFGAFDCNATLENKYICNRTFNIIKYPRFLLFKNTQLSRMYNVKCPRLADFFYTWIVSRGDENFCSGSVTVASQSDKRSSSNTLNLMFAIFTGYWRTVFA